MTYLIESSIIYIIVYLFEIEKTNFHSVKFLVIEQIVIKKIVVQIFILKFVIFQTL